MRAEFSVQGEPVGKGRPRFTKTGHAFTPQKTRDYEELVKLAYERQCQNYLFEGAVRFEILACFGMPKSASREKRADMLAGNIKPTKKPDIDNIIKIVADALNGRAYHDDSQIVSVSGKKEYALNPVVYVIITEV